jgi:hypothetical protein
MSSSGSYDSYNALLKANQKLEHENLILATKLSTLQ